MCSKPVSVPVSVSQFFRSNIPQDTLTKLAVLYCNIWKEEPWNEDFWKPEYVADDIMLELALANATAFLAMADGDVVGFTHGYNVNQADMQKIASNNLLDYLFETNVAADDVGVARDALGATGNGSYYSSYIFDSEQDHNDPKSKTYFYIDELGVDSAYRGKGVGKQLTYALVAYAETMSIDGVILRTDVLAVAARALYVKAGFTEIPVRDANHPTRTYWVKSRSASDSRSAGSEGTQRVSGFDNNPHMK